MNPQSLKPNLSENFRLITLDARSGSDLDWKEKKEEALIAKESGQPILWNLQLGLFDDLTFPLHHEMQFQNLALGIDCFKEFYLPFKEDTLGVCLYQGRADFASIVLKVGYVEEEFHLWKKQRDTLDDQLLFPLFARDQLGQFFHLLADRLDSPLPFLFLDLEQFQDEQEMAIMLHPDIFRRFQLVLKSSSIPIGSFVWKKEEENILKVPIELPTVAICLPSLEKIQRSDLQPVFCFLKENKIAYRIISETWLTSDWEGVDELLFPIDALCSFSKRKVMGFLAAGGKVISVPEGSIGLEGEISFQDYMAST